MSGRRCGDLGERCKRSQRLQLDLECGPRCICCKHAGSGRATPRPYMPKAPSRAIERDPVEKYVGPILIIKGLRVDGRERRVHI
jgi:hypothetical protein